MRLCNHRSQYDISGALINFRNKLVVPRSLVDKNWSHDRIQASQRSVSTESSATKGLREKRSEKDPHKPGTKVNTGRGMRDILPPAYLFRKRIHDLTQRVAFQYGFDRVESPIMEREELFVRTIGDSEIVHKQMFTASARDQTNLEVLSRYVLRPEGTASICRMITSSESEISFPFRVYYQGPMFRYERPQRGRLRQFHQIGIENFGDDTPFADAESISCAYHILSQLGLANHVMLKINSLGTSQDRAEYNSILATYLTSKMSRLSPDSMARLQSISGPGSGSGSVLRILDSKHESDRDVIRSAPQIWDHLSASSRNRFRAVLGLLDMLEIPYEVDMNLVRGLDYYCHTAFEFVESISVTSDDKGQHVGIGTGKEKGNRVCSGSEGKQDQALGKSQNAVLGGGRYDGLLAQLGGPNVSAIGWAAGVERLELLVQSVKLEPQSHPSVLIDSHSGMNPIQLSYHNYSLCPDVWIVPIYSPGISSSHRHMLSCISFALMEQIRHVGGGLRCEMMLPRRYNLSGEGNANCRFGNDGAGDRSRSDSDISNVKGKDEEVVVVVVNEEHSERNVSKHTKAAAKSGARFCVFVGADEAEFNAEEVWKDYNNGRDHDSEIGNDPGPVAFSMNIPYYSAILKHLKSVRVKNMATQTQRVCTSLDELLSILQTPTPQ